MDYKDIIYTKEEGIATITLNRPDARNSYIPEMLEGIFYAMKDAAEDDGVRVLVLTGAGQAFCAGADVKAMAERVDRTSGEHREREQRVIEKQRVFEKQFFASLHRFEKPLIAAVNGVAAGAGLDIALGCDFRIASDKARFAEVFIRRGLIPVGGGTYYLPRLVGIDRACLLILTGDMVDAKEAERIGLVTMVVPHEELESATWELAAKLVKAPPPGN
ncbi:enoyl-CoA hydratase/isomerase family protein [Chloroflexota bacterium]